MVAVTDALVFFSPVTLAPVMMVMPWLSNRLWASAAISASSTGRIRSNTSTTVTLAPSVLKKLANSMPMAPEPMTSSDFGMVSGTRASK